MTSSLIARSLSKSIYALHEPEEPGKDSTCDGKEK
jgi:hypothetical protein